MKKLDTKTPHESPFEPQHMPQHTMPQHTMPRRGFLNGMLGGGAVLMGAALGGGMMSPSAIPALQEGAPAAGSILNVKDFGAVGDGATDATAAFQQALDTAAAQGGGTVIVPTGVYIISASLNLKSNTTMTGEGIGRTILKVPDGHNGEMIGLIRTEWGVSTQNVLLSDMTLDGNRENQQGGEHFGFYSGVKPDSPESDYDVYLSRLEARNFTGYGIDPHEVTTRLYIVDCICHHNGTDGFTLDGIADSIVQGCISYANDRHGFNIVTNTHHTVIQNCIARENTENGFTVQNGSNNNLIVSNISYQNRGDGIYVAGVADNVINNNHVAQNLAYGIRIRGCARTSITGNRLNTNSQREHEAYNEIHLDDDADIGSTECLIANNHVTCSGDIRAKYGISETPGRDTAVQSQNAFLANAVFGASISNYNITGDDTRRAANA